MEQPDRERRRYPRFSIATAQIECFRAPRIPFFSQPLPASLRDLSAGGVSLQTTAEIKNEDTLTGKVFIVDTKDTIRLTARVQWVRTLARATRNEPARHVVGLAFVNRDPGEQARIESMRKWFSSDRYRKTARRTLS